MSFKKDFASAYILSLGLVLSSEGEMRALTFPALPETLEGLGGRWGVPMAPALCPQRLLEDLGSPWCLAQFLHSAGVSGRSRASGGLVTQPSLLLLKLNPLASPTRSKHLVCHAKNIPQQRALPPAVKLISGLKNSPKSLYWQL